MRITNENLDCCILTLFVHNVCNFSCSFVMIIIETEAIVGP